MTTRPNIVLVHGAWADGSSWSAVIERLHADGYHVTAPQFPLTSLADDVARLRQVLNIQSGPTIVAGHSYGGQIMTAMGADTPNVSGLVYVAAFGLDAGESLGALLSQGPVTSALEHMTTDAQGFAWLSEDDFVNHFAADVDRAKARVMHAAAADRRLGVQRRDGPAGLEVATDVVPDRQGGRGPPSRRRASVRRPDGRHHRRGTVQPRRHGLPSGRRRRPDRNSCPNGHHRQLT